MKKQEQPIILQDEITLGGQTISYRMRKSVRAKNLRLSISEENGLEVVLPKQYSLGEISQIEDFLRQKEVWILDKMKLMAEQTALKEAAEGNFLSRIRYLDQEYPIVVILDSDAPIRVELNGDKALFTLPENREELIQQVIQAWYPWAAKQFIEERCPHWAEKMRVSYQRIYIKNQKSRWGSCSGSKNLSFNMRLIMAPIEVVDYVIIHELTHLKEMNHSPVFWQMVADFCPSYQEHRDWLKKYGAGLIL
ncbi:M48 family metallopeptidase [Dehalobacterium formicoaceticum]|uniref:M48 family metallopeptidase n=1 Tax=Dehalobacterium formicoaceticum TaxID=51515 RepID=A0ABT1Y0I1_9FIRM|nr:SprT family zinc-dependent metalloprotease [Dehalobacterium formicoaceticum]MCR6544379.1 M48 family metallopeptidase [Dehalobacterium formicoaceticum]